MRSRDGAYSILRTICAIILFCSLALDASEYLISYRYVVKDAILYNEHLDISPAMQRCTGNPQKSLFLDPHNTDDLTSVIDTNKEEFINFLHKLGLQVKHRSKTTNLQNSSTTVLTLKTTCFKVDFNDTFVKITPLK
ncbi:hypothetical protein [Sulfurimonas sp. C5]|uniref:hypothetical protein n=1 Tax=Sulfurimonas sp. C5 TaxID=3036947 RepID=UPI002457E3B0|nr:hypothetical protein [Sulfurimonas sp. C5]MDH4944925.1 hypothetical protein [Sulfurimonas sp. C5]